MVAFFPTFLLFICCWLVEGDRDVVITELEKVDDCERRTKSGDRVYVRYTGSIDETSATGKPSTVFDSNMKSRAPLEFYIGTSLPFLQHLSANSVHVFISCIGYSFRQRHSYRRTGNRCNRYVCRREKNTCRTSRIGLR